MKGPTPKPAHLLQRKNRAATAATLLTTALPRQRAPALPREYRWHPLTRRWWSDVWHSRMAAEFLQADIHGLYRLAILIDQFWEGESPDLAAEIRLQQAAYGLTPIDRRRLAL